MKKLSIYNYTILKFVIFFLIFTLGINGNAQFYNKEFVAKIDVNKDSEFYTFTATAENLTPTDVDLRYDFVAYKADENDSVSKSNQSNLFFLKGNEKVVLSTTTVNYNEAGKITILLVLYDLNDKPLGQDRIELMNENGYQEVKPERLFPQKKAATSDQAPPQDGFVLDGLVVQKTLTKAGRDFYRYFYAEFYNLGVKTKKNILIEEVPGRFRNTRISIKIDDKTLWQFFSQPKKSYLQSMARTALDRCIVYLQQIEQQNDNSLTRY